MRPLGLLITCFALSVAQAGLAQSIPVTSDFKSIRHDWPQKSGALEIRWAAIPKNGSVLICGAVRHINARARKANRGLLRKGWVRRGSQTGPIVLRDLSFFTDTRSAGFDTAMANCRPVTGFDTALYLGFDPHSGYDAHMDMF